jgi:hypothetical protein
LSHRRVSFFLLLFVSWIVISLSAADEPRRIYAATASKQGVGQNIGFVEKLVHESAAAKQIQQSDNQQAKALREKAITYLDEAKAAQAKGDADAVAQALNQAKKAIFSGMRLVGGEVVKDKKRQNYKQKRHGLDALLAAHQRIRQEMEQQAESEKLNLQLAQEAALSEKHVREKIQEAQAHYDKDELDEAGAILNDAYLGLKISLRKMREGKTLVRSLEFASKEDEYRYELKRNDTHNILINTVLKEKREDPRLGKLMDIPLNKAEQLRHEAEQQAASGDFEGAIKTLEESTKYIIRAIRLGGIFVPG